LRNKDNKSGGKRRQTRTLFYCFFIFVCFWGCGKPKIQKWERERFLFGTFVGISVYDADGKAAEKAMEAAFAEIERIDAKFNSKREGSLVYKINHMENSPESPKEIPLDEEGEYLFSKIREAWERSGGEYDVTLGPMMALWGFGQEDPEKLRIPSAGEIASVLQTVDFSKVSFADGKLSIAWPVREIDTGSFLKGYALQRAWTVLEKKGIKSAFITSVSSIAAVGSKPEGIPWRIGIQNPADLSALLGAVDLKERAMGVSGDYQTFLEIDGKLWHHILKKTTGFPVDDKKMTVVIAPDAFMADIYSTCFFLMPVDKILDFVYTNNYLDILIVKSNGEIIMSDGFPLIKLGETGKSRHD
jgi:thiamine biosynthesis lipoprotein